MGDPSELGPEWNIVEGLARSYREPADVERVKASFATNELNVAELVDQAIRQRVLTRLAIAVGGAPRGMIPRRLKEHLRHSLGAQQHQLRVLRAEVVRVSAALHARGVRHAVTKGMALESVLFPDGARELSDIDLMIAPHDHQTVRAILAELGYEMGFYDWASGSIRVDPWDVALSRMHPDHLPKHAKLTGDLVRPSVALDFAASFTWSGSEWDVPIDECLAHLVLQEVPGTDQSIPVFEPHVHFLFLILHLFREAWFERTVSQDKDDLAKFADVHAMWCAWGDRIAALGFSSLTRRFGLVPPVAWVLVHLQRTLGTDAAAVLGFDREASEEWLASASAAGGGMLTWRGSMRERLHSRSRMSLFTATAEAALPGAG